MLVSLDSQIAAVKREARKSGQQKERVQRLVDEKIAAADKEETSRPKRGAGTLEALMNVDEPAGSDAMDVDENDGRSIRRASKRGGFGLGRFN